MREEVRRGSEGGGEVRSRREEKERERERERSARGGRPRWFRDANTPRPEVRSPCSASTKE